MTTQRRTRLSLESLEDRLALSAVTSAPVETPTSTNWSGYAAATSLANPQYGSVSAVAGAWTVPTVTGPSTGKTYSSVWVGIDGLSSPTVEQIGTEEDVVNGQAQYYAWFEMFPRGPVTISSMKVKPGDQMVASVSYAGFGFFQLTMTDQTEHESFSTMQWSPFALRSSAEWIVEAPSSATGTLPLANFGAATFTGAYVTMNGQTGPINGPWQFTAINMIKGPSGPTQASTSGLTDSGTGSKATSSFTVTYIPTGSSAATGISGHHGPGEGNGHEFF